MKFTLKRTISVVLAFVVCVGVLCGCFGGETGDKNTVTYVVVGAERNDTARIMERIQEIVLEKTGQKLEFQYVSNSTYDLTISSGEPVDLLYAPDAMNYWPNAAKGAFAEISDEDLKKYAPYIWENMQDVINVSKYKGVRYGIPQKKTFAPDRCLVARGDLMDKYGIKDLNSIENIEKFLDAVKANEKDMIPFDVPGDSAYVNLSMFASDWGWCPVGSLSFSEPIFFDIDDPEHKLFIAAEQPEMLEFTKTMKRWNEKGFFSKSVLSNKTKSINSFKAGRTALALVNNPTQCQSTYDELTADDRKEWDIRFFTRYQEKQAMFNVMSNAVAISAFSDNVEGSLKVLNEIYANKELHNLILYGFEGEHYVINDDGSMSVTEKSEDKGYLSAGVYNDAWAFETSVTFPGSEELVQKLYDQRFVNPAVNMPKDKTNVREIEAALTEVYNQYTIPRYYGAFSGTAEEAIEKELKELRTAGIDTLLKEYQRQLDEYLSSTGQ